MQSKGKGGDLATALLLGVQIRTYFLSVQVGLKSKKIFSVKSQSQ